MKKPKFLLLFLCLNLSLSLSAQTYSLGGYADISANWEHRKGEFYDSKVKISRAYLTPSFQYFATNRLMIGSGLTLGERGSAYRRASAAYLQRGLERRPSLSNHVCNTGHRGPDVR